MKSIRRSPVARVTAWLLTLALIAPMLLIGHAARAQDDQVLKVVITDSINKSAGNSTLGPNATAALYSEFAGSGLGKFNVVSTTEIRNEATSLGLKVPSNPTAPFNWSESDWLRVAKSLGADSLVNSDVSATRVTGRVAGMKVALVVTLKDVAAQVLTNGGAAEVTASPRPGEPFAQEELLNKAVSDAALTAVRGVVSHQIVAATVLNINSDTVILNRGLRDGVHVGDHIQILRDNGQGAKYPVGDVLVQQAYATDSEAHVVHDPGGIRPEDIGRVVYTPNIVVLPTPLPTPGHAVVVDKTISAPNSSHGALSMSVIGGTIAVIAVGVLLSSANKGGQISITDLTAEPTSQANSAAVLIRWRDNIFGQGNVEQYKIYREPDFPFVSVGATSSNGNNGGGTTTTTVVAYPIAVRAGVDHSYLDLPSPNFAYSNGGQILVAFSNGGLGSQGATSGGSNNGGGNNSSLAVIPAPVLLDTGFTAGKNYQYQVTAIILRTIPSSGSSNGNNNGGGTGGGTGGGGNNGGGGGNNGGGGGNGNNSGGGSEYIETDPSITSNVTPVSPAPLSTPTPAAGNINSKSFTPTWQSVTGADVFVVEISTDRTFKTPSMIYSTGLIVSTAPFANGVAQSVPAPIDLTVLPQLLANPAFAAFVAQTSGASPSSPLIYWRVGARHDEDSPGPLNWITNNSMDPDRTYRFVYTQPIYFTAAPGPPPPPTGSRASKALNAIYTTRGLLAPSVGGGLLSGRSSGTHVLSPQDILAGRGRKRN